MRQITLLLFVVFISVNNSYGQKILIKDNCGNPIPNVHVFTNFKNALSDDQGHVTFGEISDSIVFFQHLSYETTWINGDIINQSEVVVYLKEVYHKACEVELIGRLGKQKKELFQQLETLHLKDLILSQAQSTPELLQKNAGVFMQKSQMGGGSPIVRGFEANKLLLVIDGIRLNNAIYRSGHLHNILSIDEQLLEKVDLVYGPGALNYGSDAIGGVIHFVSKQPKTNQRFANYYSSYASANNGIKSYIDFNISNKKIASLSSLSYGVYGDMLTGSKRKDPYLDFGKRYEYVSTDNGVDEIITNNNPNRQVGTSYNQWNVSNKIKYIYNDNLSVGTNLQYSSSSDIPRYDRLTEYKNGTLKYAEWNYGPQNRLLAAANIKYYTETKLFDQLKLIASFQQLSEERIKRKFQNPSRTSNKESIDVWGTTLDFVKHIDKNQKLTYGIDGQFNDVSSTVSVRNIIDNTDTGNALTRYPNGNNTMYSSGIYTNYFIDNLVNNISASIGLRYQYIRTDMSFDKQPLIQWDDSYYKGIYNENTALTWSGAVKWQPISSIALSWMSATAFRAPNIDDLAKIRVKGNEISFINTQLTPEKSISHELNFNFKPIDNNSSMLNVALFQTNLKDAIIRQEFEFNGSKLFVQNEDTLHIVANVNSDKATVKGISVGMSIEIIENLLFDASITKIVGKSQNKDNEKSNPLAHIPPMYGKAGLQYQKDIFTCKLSYQYYDNKSVSEYGGSSDNLSYATTDGTLSYHLWDINSSFHIDDKLILNVGVNNVFDRHYRLFASGVSGPGRNIIISVKGKIE